MHTNLLRFAEIAMAPHLYAAEFKMTPNCGGVVNVEHPDVLGAVALGADGFRRQRDAIVRSMEALGNKNKLVWC